MFNSDQKAAALSEAQSIPVLLWEHLSQESGNAEIFLLALINYVHKTSPFHNSDLIGKINLTASQNPVDLSKQMQNLLTHMVEVGVDDDSMTRIYTTGDIARFFGVTVATVNNWINENRLTGVEKRVRFKQARIPETAIYKSITGETMIIKEAAEIYKTEQQRTSIRSLTPTQELQELLNEIIFFEKKYEGELKNTLAKKEKLTPAEERDAAEWKHLLHEIEGLVHEATATE